MSMQLISCFRSVSGDTHRMEPLQRALNIEIRHLGSVDLQKVMIGCCLPDCSEFNSTEVP